MVIIQSNIWSAQLIRPWPWPVISLSARARAQVRPSGGWDRIRVQTGTASSVTRPNPFLSGKAPWGPPHPKSRARLPPSQLMYW